MAKKTQKTKKNVRKKPLKAVVKKKAKTKKLSPLDVARKELLAEIKKKKQELARAEKEDQKAEAKADALREKARKLEEKAHELQNQAIDLEDEASQIIDSSDTYVIEEELYDLEMSLDELDLVEPDQVMPRTGKIVGYKAVRCDGNFHNRAIAELEIPAKAKRYQSFPDDLKCRASEAKVLSITVPDDETINATGKFSSLHDNSYTYSVGKIVKPKNAFSTEKEACASGIHFFMTREQAVNY